MEKEFLEYVFDEIKDEIRTLLPPRSRFVEYHAGEFSFIKRDRKKVFLYKTVKSPLELIRKGVTSKSITREEITPDTWRLEHTLYGAPDGMYVSATTYGQGRYEDFISYGVVHDGKYEKMHGKMWSGAREFFQIWNFDAEPVRVDGCGRVFVNFRKMYWYSEEGETWKDIAHKLNEKACEYRASYKPSPHYYEESRWSYKDGEWCFK
jgi:hypothetical protein